MKTIQFTGTEKQLYNLQDIIEQSNKNLPQETEKRVYVVDVHSTVNKHHSHLTDEEFMSLAEDQGTVHTLKGFQEDYNIGKYEMHYVIRFISVFYAGN